MTQAAMRNYRKAAAFGVVVATLVALSAIAGWQAARIEADKAKSAVDQAQAAEDFVAQIKAACDDPQSELGKQLRTSNRCGEAKKVLKGSKRGGNLSPEDRAEISSIAREALAEQPALSVDEVVDRVVRRLPKRGADQSAAPTLAQIRAEIARYYAANPPRDGRNAPRPRDGKPGQDGTSAPGAPGADSTIPGPRGPSCVEELGIEACRGDSGKDGAPGKDGTATPGSYACGDGEYLSGFTLAEGGAVSLNCRALPSAPTPQENQP